MLNHKIWITVSGKLVTKKTSQRIVRAGRFPKILPSAAYVRWEAHSRKHVTGKIEKMINPPDLPLHGQIEVKARIYYKGNRPDLSGALESIGDCFEGILWENDRQIVSWDGSRLIHDKKNPRVELTVSEFFGHDQLVAYVEDMELPPEVVMPKDEHQAMIEMEQAVAAILNNKKQEVKLWNAQNA